MRVIAGMHKGRRLKAVPGNETRPTTDKIKEAMFQVMGPFFDGGVCLDLFAGSGSLGIEALSRGMEKIVFVDKQVKAIQTIKENLAQLKCDQMEVYRMDAFIALQTLSKNAEKYDLILLDPPYQKVDYDKCIESILKYDLLKDDGILYCEHHPENIMPEIEQLEMIKHKAYSNTIAITIYKRLE